MLGGARRDQHESIPVDKDSLYKPIVRQPRKFNPLAIPTKLEAELPFAGMCHSSDRFTSVANGRNMSVQPSPSSTSNERSRHTRRKGQL